MTLAELLERKLSINLEQRLALEDILLLNKTKKQKLIIREKLKNEFYTSFSVTEFAKEVEVLPFGVSWNAVSHRKNKLKVIQKHLLREI